MRLAICAVLAICGFCLPVLAQQREPAAVSVSTVAAERRRQVARQGVRPDFAARRGLGTACQRCRYRGQGGQAQEQLPQAES